jgi:uncharacterized protein DUF6882
MLQAEKQLKPVQLQLLCQLTERAHLHPESLWGDWLLGREPVVAANLSSWLELGANYVAGVLRQEAKPPAVDWGRREQELNTQLASYPGKIEIDLENGTLVVVKDRTISAQSSVQVLGTYDEKAKSYLSGWSDPSLSRKVRPLPIFGCASQLFRIDWVDAQSEAHRAGWLGKVRFVFEYRRSDRVLFLGLERPEEPGSGATYEKKDLTPEMSARVETLLKALDRYDPERIKSLLKSQSQEVHRLVLLVKGNQAVGSLLTITAETLEDLATRISTQNMLGVHRTNLTSRDRELLKEELSQIRLSWES